MSGTTTNEGYPYPYTSDFADVQDVFRLATAVDLDLLGEQAPFRAFMARPSFIGRQQTTQSGSISGDSILQMQTVEWDNTGGAGVGGFTTWKQPLNAPPAWWLFGSTIFVANLATPVVGVLTMGQIQVSTVDQVTGVSSLTTFFQRNDESNTNGEWINLFAMAPIYQGQVQAVLTISGTTSKALGAASRLWGMYLGPVT